MDTQSNYEPHYEDRGPRTPPYWLIALTGVVLGAVVALIGVLLLVDDEQAIDTTGTTTTVGPTTSAVTVPTSTSTTTSTTTSTATTASTATSASTTSTTQTTTSTATTTTASTSSTSSSSTSSTVPGPYLSAVWPWPSSATRYTDPVDAARGFAEDFVGFTNPRVGPFMQGDSKSGEVEIKPRANGPVTVVFVRKLGPDDDWWVLGAATDNIRVDEPDALDVIDDPLTVSGAASISGGEIGLLLRADGSLKPLIDVTIMDGTGEMVPFEWSVAWTKPDDGAGAVIVTNRSADGDVWAASVVRVLFD